ncbi:MAG: DUF4384 domain-containing protein [Prevotella sp.]|nr:DUF4384 domain-containing protein [Prevotella sp.]
MFLLSTPAFAQRVENVSGEYTYVIHENDDITLREAKRKCLELAKASAIKEKFGELITSDVIDSNVETNGESTSSYFWENTVAMAKGEWLGDTEQPIFDVSYKDGQLIFTTKVKGMAREIIQSKADLKWEILKDGNEKKIVTQSFDSGERIYVSFRSPSNGYVAVYLIVGDDETSCLLPYPQDADGRFPVKAGRDYLFFDKQKDPQAFQYRLKTKHRQEDNQLVIIYSPNPFTKCNDITGDKNHPNSLSTHDFQKWLLKCQREDRDMVVNKKWIKILQKAK